MSSTQAAAKAAKFAAKAAKLGGKGLLKKAAAGGPNLAQHAWVFGMKPPINQHHQVASSATRFSCSNCRYAAM